MVRDRSAQLAASLEDIRESYDFTLEALVAMLDAREHHTGKHSLRVRELAVTLATEMGITGEELENLASGALLHDLGKISIPDAILFRPGPLADDEWEKMKTHSQVGYEILRSSPALRQPAEMVRQHHEHWDGSGYPQGLKGEEIWIGARIFSICDAYDAMRSLRVYRDPLPVSEVITEMERNSGKQFDPAVVEAFLRVQPELERLLQED